MAKQLIQNVKGTRDFYPEDKAVQNWLYEKMRKVSELYGYQEYDGPELEYLDLYADKTSEEILREQAFTLKDRDERTLMLRPELTPTFARMVAEKARELMKPIRWYMFGRCWRYEQPQRGRGREFFQWEINVLGPETPEADAEILAIACSFFREVGLTPEEVVIRVNDRSYFDQVLRENGIAEEKKTALLRIIDRKEKVDQAKFDGMLREQGLNDEQVAALNSYFAEKDYSKAEWLSKVFTSLQNYPVTEGFIVYDPVIARGLDYYTRTVFEAWDKTGGLRRALFGGGRFDNLTATIGGERVPGVGMAPGDMPILEVLEQFGKLPTVEVKMAEVLVTVFDENLAGESERVASRLREVGIRTECWVEVGAKLDKQLRYASQKGIRYVVIVGSEEVSKGLVKVKDMNNGEQVEVSVAELSVHFQK